jgi:hypothetical protein
MANSKNSLFVATDDISQESNALIASRQTHPLLKQNFWGKLFIFLLK